MKKICLLGGLSISLLLVVILYKSGRPEKKTYLTKNDLNISENQAGYSESNLGVSIFIKEEVDRVGTLEFEVENQSDKKWYWRRYIVFNGEDEDYTLLRSDLEIKIEEVWYNIPLQEDVANVSMPLLKRHLLPGATITIPIYISHYQMVGPGNYRFTIVVYDDEGNEIGLSNEFWITEEV